MEELFYTHALWRVKPNREAEFIAAWNGLASVFSNLPHKPIRSTLLQNLTDPTLFYSFGPWRSLADIEAMRSDPQSQEAFRKIMELCVEANPSTYRVVADIQL